MTKGRFNGEPDPDQLTLFDLLADAALDNENADPQTISLAHAVKALVSGMLKPGAPDAPAQPLPLKTPEDINAEWRRAQQTQQQKQREEWQKRQQGFREAQRLQRETWLKQQEERQREARRRREEDIRRHEEAKRRREEEERRAAEQKRVEDERRKLEHDKRVAAVTSMDLPLDWVSAFSGDERVRGVHVDSPADGLIKSLTELGRVDIEYIAQISGYTVAGTLDALRGSIFQNPERWDECFYKGWETSDAYLSGNLMRKYRTAREASDTYNGYFQENLDAIGRVLPFPLTAGDIYVTIGTPWIPPDVIDAFMLHLFGNPRDWTGVGHPSEFNTRYEPVTGAWSIPFKQRYAKSPQVERTFGTRRVNALHLLERTLNMRTIAVYDRVKGSVDGKVKDISVLNKDETVAATEKQQRMIAEFKKWIWSDEGRRTRLVDIYTEKFGSVRRRVFDGGFLTLPGLETELYGYQRDAVARILLTPNTLLAHEVGAGKTYIMAAAGMELRRVGISRKNIFVVPNNIIGQWAGIFRKLYPKADVFTVTPKDFVPLKRQSVLAEIRDSDHDAVIMAYSSFELIPMSFQYKKKELERELSELDAAEKTARQATDRLKARRKTLLRELEEINQEIEDTPEGARGITFDELGITTIFLDEAHNYKNVSIDSKTDNILGINKTGSAKCNEMMAKVRFVQRANNGRGAVFATGTPVTNSVTDIYIMQKYLQTGELRFLDLEHFDNWAATFGEKVTEFEIDVDTTTYRLATRFSRFHNLPELTALLAQVADFHQVDADNLPDSEGYTDSLIRQTPALRAYIQQLSERADGVRSRLVPRTADNMLKITTDGRKAALDIRLTVPDERFSTDSKAYQCAERVYELYRQTRDKRLTQLVFCDSSTPKAAFNMYGELRRLLVLLGMPETEIEFVHDHDTDRRREELFTRMRTGAIRVLLGSTFKLGIGVNVQHKLVAVHHLDIPWRPSDMIQREGRMLRQGNENDSVRIFRYITEGSFDAYSWQLLETKQRFISQLLGNTVTQRDASDIDDVVLDYAEVKALAVGNPLLKQRVETANELSQLLILQRKSADARASMLQELAALPAKIESLDAFLEKARLDLEHYNQNKTDIRDMENHRETGRRILEAASGYALQGEPKYLFTYQGFRVVLPENMLAEKPAVRLENEGRYYVELGSSDTGCIYRIDNRLNSLEATISDRETAAGNLRLRVAELEAAVAGAEYSGEDYSVKIDGLRGQLADIDKKLEAGKNAGQKRK